MRIYKRDQEPYNDGYIAQHCDFKDLAGKTFVSVTKTTFAKIDEYEALECYGDVDVIIFKLKNGDEYRLYHEQRCCEDVFIESIVGDLSGLENTVITLAEEVSVNTDTVPDGHEVSRKNDYMAWTFYKLATKNGYVDIRFFGASTGAYSVKAAFKFYKISQYHKNRITKYSKQYDLDYRSLTALTICAKELNLVDCSVLSNPEIGKLFYALNELSKKYILEPLVFDSFGMFNVYIDQDGWREYTSPMTATERIYINTLNINNCQNMHPDVYKKINALREKDLFSTALTWARTEGDKLSGRELEFDKNEMLGFNTFLGEYGGSHTAHGNFEYCIAENEEGAMYEMDRNAKAFNSVYNNLVNISMLSRDRKLPIDDFSRFEINNLLDSISPNALLDVINNCLHLHDAASVIVDELLDLMKGIRKEPWHMKT